MTVTPFESNGGSPAYDSMVSQSPQSKGSKAEDDVDRCPDLSEHGTPVCMRPLTRWLYPQNIAFVTFFAAVVSFGCYLCIYGFRKPWSSITYAKKPLIGGMKPKDYLVMMQVIGYAVGKSLAIPFIAWVKPGWRFPILITLPCISSIVWIIFGAVATEDGLSSAGWVILFSSMPLSWAWGLEYRYLEGRRGVDFLGNCLSAAIVLGSGFAKSIGKSLSRHDELHNSYYVAAAACGVYILPFFICSTLVSSIPPPTRKDVEQMGKRQPMNWSDQLGLFKRHWVGIMSVCVSYMLLTAMRDYRDDFQADIWEELYGESDPSIFTSTEIPVGVSVLFLLVWLNLIHSNRKAVLATIAAMFFGILLSLVSQILFDVSFFSGSVWFVLIGVGTFLGYVPIGSFFFDRVLGATEGTFTVANCSFLISIADACGYIATVIMLIIKNAAFPKDMSYHKFYQKLCYFSCSVQLLLIVVSVLYWNHVSKESQVQGQESGNNSAIDSQQELMGSASNDTNTHSEV